MTGELSGEESASKSMSSSENHLGSEHIREECVIGQLLATDAEEGL